MESWQQLNKFDVSMVQNVSSKMDIDPIYTFVPLPEKKYIGLNDKSTIELFAKWGLNFSVQEYLFNEPFYPYHKYQLAEAFFKDDTVAKTLKVFQGYSWLPRGIPASSIVVKQIPCSILNMSFFDRLKNPANNVVYESGTICKRCDVDIDQILVSDNLRGMLLDNETPEYLLYSDNDREEFIFKLFQMLVIGGELCQYEDELEPYLRCTKNLYKDLIRVQKSRGSDALTVGTLVLEVVAKNEKEISYYPCESNHKRNNAFLLVDGDRRLIKTIAHQSSGYFV